MKLNNNYFAALIFTGLFAACAGESTVEAPVAEEPLQLGTSAAGLKIEQAERLLERGGDAEQAKRLLFEAISEEGITNEERHTAVLGLTRAHEALGNVDAAVAIVEKELAAHHEDDGFPKGAYRDRLRQLLQDDQQHPRTEPRYREPAPAFARHLGTYFSPDDNGRVVPSTYIMGGDRSVSEELGTFNVGAGIRATAETSCPLCDFNLKISVDRTRGDWVLIPERGDKLENALVVYYFDLYEHRIPERYEAHLPMKVADIVAKLEDGKSFVVAEERTGAPPVILMAAPRAALLADVERALASLDHLPVEPLELDVPLQLRPEEIQSVIGNLWKPMMRGCYEQLVERSPGADGKVICELVVAGDGTVTEAKLKDPTAPFDDATFVKCMTESVKSLTFPATGTGYTTIRYPIVMRPNDNE